MYNILTLNKISKIGLSLHRSEPPTRNTELALIKPSPQNLRMLIQNPTGTLSKKLLGWKNHGLQLPIQTRVRLLSRTLKEHSSIRLRLRVQKALMNAVLLQLIHFRVVAFGNRQS